MASRKNTDQAKNPAPAKKVSPVRKAVATKKKRPRSPAPVVGVLFDDNGTLSIRVGDTNFSLSELADLGNAELTLRVALSNTKLARSAQPSALLDLTKLLRQFLNQRAVGGIESSATCGNTGCRTEDEVGKDDDES